MRERKYAGLTTPSLQLAVLQEGFERSYTVCVPVSGSARAVGVLGSDGGDGGGGASEPKECIVRVLGRRTSKKE